MKEIFNLGPDAESPKDIERYETEGEARTLSLVCGDGMQQCLNYSYLISRQLSPDKGTIALDFTSHTVTLKGSNLQELFNDFARDIPKKVAAVESRYAATKDENETMVSDIAIQKNG